MKYEMMQNYMLRKDGKLLYSGTSHAEVYKTIPSLGSNDALLTSLKNLKM